MQSGTNPPDTCTRTLTPLYDNVKTWIRPHRHRMMHRDVPLSTIVRSVQVPARSTLPRR